MRILIYRLGSLGDTVLALPSFRIVRRAYPEAKITVLTNAPVSGKAAPLEAILAGTGLMNAVISYPVGLRHPRELKALAGKLRAEKFDLAISLTAARGVGASIRDWLFLKACGIPRVAGIPFRPREMTCARRADGRLFESEAERLLQRVDAFGRADLRDPRWYDPGLSAEEKEAAGRLLAEAGITGRFLAASLGTKSPLNDWGDANWGRFLAETSRAHPGLGLVLLGSADEAARNEALLANWRGPTANLCGKTAPRESAAVLARAAVFAGHDSGPMHLAAAAGARCVAIYSARCPPGQWFPLGRGHTVLYPMAFYDAARTEDAAWQREALESIRVEDVVRAVAAVLDGSKEGGSVERRGGT